MTSKTMRVASIGIGWWSVVLADAAGRTDGRIEIAACYTRSPDKREAFAAKYGCRPAGSLEEIAQPLSRYDRVLPGLADFPRYIHAQDSLVFRDDLDGQGVIGL